MVSMEDWVTIRNLRKKNPGIGTRKIASLLGISRNTVRRAISSETYPGYHKEAIVPALIDPFAAYIKESYLVSSFLPFRQINNFL